MLKMLALTISLLVVLGLAVHSPPALALPPAGVDFVYVSAHVNLTSRLGQETISLSGTASISRSDPYEAGGLEQVDLELVSLTLAGNSVTGPVSIVQSATTVSVGTLTSNQSGQEWPASANLDVYLEIEAPASPDPTISLHNNVPFQVQPMFGGTPLSISSWPPTALPWEADLSTCITLIPQLPKDVCVTALSFSLSGSPSGGVGGFAQLPTVTRSDSASTATQWLGGALVLMVALAIGARLLRNGLAR